jgi:hypothetical protein
VQIGVGEPPSEATLRTDAAGLLSEIRAFAEKELTQPESETLLADPARAVKEQAGWERAAASRIAQLRLQGGVTVQTKKSGGRSRGAWWHFGVTGKIV